MGNAKECHVCEDPLTMVEMVGRISLTDKALYIARERNLDHNGRKRTNGGRVNARSQRLVLAYTGFYFPIENTCATKCGRN